MNQFGNITSADYAGMGAGWGMVSNDELAELNKAITGSMTTSLTEGIVTAGAGSAGDAGKIRLQSIENTLKWVEYQDKHIRLWKDIPKQPAYSTTEEYSKFSAYGSAGGEGFIAEVGTPQTMLQSYERDVAYVKFIGVRKATSIVSTLVKNQVGDMEAHEVKVGTTELLGMTERNLIWGDSRVNAQAWKGIVQQCEEACRTSLGVWKGTTNFPAIASVDPSFCIVDLQGAPLSPDVLERNLVRVASSPNYGFISDIYAPYSVFGDFSLLYWSQQILTNPGPAGGQRIGVPLTGYNSTVGAVNFKPMPLLAPNRGLSASTTTHYHSAEAATIPTGAPTIASPTATGSDSTLPADTYYYWCSTTYLGYESVAAAVGGVTSTANQYIPIKATSSGIGDGTSGALRVYRSTQDDIATARWLADVPLGYTYTNTGMAASGDAYTYYNDYNQNIPDTCIAFAVDNNADQVWRFRQLAPVMKLDLAITDTSKPFMLLMFGVPIIYNPRRVILFKNIGSATISIS